MLQSTMLKGVGVQKSDMTLVMRMQNLDIVLLFFCCCLGSAFLHYVPIIPFGMVIYIMFLLCAESI